jgi:hypothetical protein
MFTLQLHGHKKHRFGSKSESSAQLALELILEELEIEQAAEAPLERKPSLYSDQFVTQYFCFGILSRWAALNLCGNYRILNETETFRIRRKPIHATTPYKGAYHSDDVAR